VMSDDTTYFRVLTIAGSDSGGGAGIQADLKTIAANGCYGLSVITALTAQNTLGVTAIHAAPVEFVGRQLDAVLSDIGADVVKIGMLFSPDLIATVAGKLQEYGVTRIVLDPVMVAQSGDKLLRDDAVAALKELLIPRAEILTPNIPEASVLLGRAVEHVSELPEAARELAGLGCRNVLVKGGHLEGEDSDDYLYLGESQRIVRLPGQRVLTKNNHGTGCTLSSAIAAFLARGETVEGAVHQAKEYITGAICAGASYRIGHGHGPVHHFWRVWGDAGVNPDRR
jgi:hydroxymethylpyrimidine/phosphomethylpyrimidine kinase